MSELNDSKRICARKAHRCENCNSTISAGDDYLRVKWLDDWGFHTAAYCLACHQLAADLFHVGVVGEDHETGAECYPYLPEVDWPDVRVTHPQFADRVDAYLARLNDPWRTPDEETDHARP